ncbi:type I polyketide synthase [Nonomuraea sp. NPDC050663]|uniref:type I polyketide synthase n=1 Tax=Nonomuraea sp. NPDC050663 TaxID=3364370 RepID=UPI0037A8C47A
MNQEEFLAIVGMAGRFPGAPDTVRFWHNVSNGVESLGGSGYGVIEEADGFDAAFFGYSPREALMLDPQHRVFLECAWAALEDAGIDPATCPGAIGVYAGGGDTGHFGTLMANRASFPGVSEWQLRLSAGADFLTSRVSYKLGLTGPAVTVQTACSTSLVAVHLAGQALLAGECDVALAGGVTVRVPAPTGEFGDEGVLSPDGRCRAFDAGASGTVGGDGAGIVVLKRLPEAIDDGDHIYAVIRGTAVTNDGSGKMGFTAPSVAGQAAAVRAAHVVADVDPATIGYVEAHGTGTPVGDPIEVRALAKAFAEGTGQVGFSVLGSVKTNIGHTDAAAGVVGLIKAALALRHELIPGTLHFRSPNPELGLEDSPFLVSAEPVPWPRGAAPRRAGVNSLGIGGTNAHAILEEAPAAEQSGAGRPVQLLPLSARAPAALRTAAARLAAHLAEGDVADAERATAGLMDADGADVGLADAAWTLQTGRRAFAHRAFVVAGDRAQAVRALRDPGLALGDGAAAPGVAFLFPGQGGQHVGMGRDLYEQEPVFRAEVDLIADLARPSLGLDLREILYGGAPQAAAEMATMRIGQPALFAVEYATARLWQSRGVVPEVVLGHSLGAYAAAVIAGVLSPADALALVLERGTLLGRLAEGAMLAVPLPEEQVVRLAGDRLSVAAVNSHDQTVLAGPAADIASLRERLAADGVDARVLRISAAAHSRLVEPVVARFEERVARTELRPPSITWISDRTGLPVTAEQACDPAYWSGHLRHTVRFADALTTLLDGSSRVLLELGPGRTLGTLARKHPGAGPGVVTVPSLPHPGDPAGAAPTMLAATGRLWQAGVAVDWTALHEGERRLRVPLPGYPFERRGFRLEPPAPVTASAPTPREVPVEAVEPTSAGAFHSAGTERALAEAFGEVLGMEPGELTPHDDFFDLGGDSVVATQVVSLIRRSVGIELSPKALFLAPTVHRLARLIEEGQAA